MHQWIALTDTSAQSKSVSDITGYLKLSIQITGKDDKAVALKEDDDEERQEAIKHCALNQVVMIPSQVQPKYVMLTLRFFTAQDLPAMDTGQFISFNKNTMDGYIKLSFVGKNFITRTITMDDKSVDKSISWNQSFNFPVQLPLLVETLQVQVWDKNESSEDTCLGSLHFKINNIIQKDIYKEAGW